MNPSINIDDLEGTFKQQVGDAYFEMACEAAERVLRACNKQVESGCSKEDLQGWVNGCLENTAQALCRAEGAGAVDDNKQPIPSILESTYAYLLDRVEDAVDSDIAFAQWEVQGDFDPQNCKSRTLVYVG